MLNIHLVQPSSPISFNFRLFKKNGKAIDLNKFCNDYQLTAFGKIQQFNFSNEQYALSYDQRSKKIRLITGTVYADVEFYFIHKTDTMAVRIINSGYGAVINIDSLVFKPGIYAIKCDSRVVNGKTLPDLPALNLKTIDFENAKATCYNYWLEEYKKLMSRETREEYAVTKVFRKLQHRYHVPKDDLSYKSPKQLNYQ